MYHQVCMLFWKYLKTDLHGKYRELFANVTSISAPFCLLQTNTGLNEIVCENASITI